MSTPQDLSPFVEDRFKDQKVLVLGGIITDDEDNKLQREPGENYDVFEPATTLAIEMEEQTREVGTWPDPTTWPKTEDRKPIKPEWLTSEIIRRWPERRYKIVDEMDDEDLTPAKVEEILYWDHNYKRPNVLYPLVAIQTATDLKKELDSQDAIGVYPVDENAPADRVEEYGEATFFDALYKDLKSRVNAVYMDNTSGAATGIFKKGPPTKKNDRIQGITDAEAIAAGWCTSDGVEYSSRSRTRTQLPDGGYSAWSNWSPWSAPSKNKPNLTNTDLIQYEIKGNQKMIAIKKGRTGVSGSNSVLPHKVDSNTKITPAILHKPTTYFNRQQKYTPFGRESDVATYWRSFANGRPSLATINSQRANIQKLVTDCVLRQTFIESKVTGKTEKISLTQNYMVSQLKLQGKTDDEIKKKMQEYTRQVARSPGGNPGAAKKFCESNNIPTDKTVFQYTRYPNGVNITYLHFVEQAELGEGFFPDDAADKDTIDNRRKESSHLEMQNETTVAVKYVDRKSEGFNKKVLDVINDEGLEVVENINHIKIGNLSMSARADKKILADLVMTPDTFKLLAERFDRITISNSVMTVILPPEETVEIRGDLTLENCKIVANNTILRIGGKLSMTGCTLLNRTELDEDDDETVEPKGVRSFTVDVVGDVTTADINLAQALNFVIKNETGVDGDAKLMASNTKYNVTSDRNYNPFLISGFSEVTVAGMVRESGQTVRCPMVNVIGCTTITIMDIDNKNADFRTLINVDTFNELNIDGVKCEPLSDFRTVANIANSKSEATVKLGGIEVRGNGLLYSINGCQLLSLKFETFKTFTDKFGEMFKTEVEKVTLSECDIRINNPVILSYECDNLTFSDSTISAANLSIPVFKKVSIDGSMIRSDNVLDIDVRSEARLSLMDSTLFGKELHATGRDKSRTEIGLTKSTLEIEQYAKINTLERLNMELSDTICKELHVVDVNVVNITDNNVHVNKTKNITFEDISNIQKGEFKLDLEGSTTVSAIRSTGEFKFDAISDTKLTRITTDSAIVDEHTTYDDVPYRLTVISNNSLASAYLIDKKYIKVDLKSKDFRYFKSIDDVVMYSKAKSLRGQYDYIYYGLEKKEEEVTSDE